jgi:MFS family permease
MCAIALIALIILFKEARPADAAETRKRARPTPMRDFLRYPHFPLVVVLLLIAQFIDRGLALLVPLHVAHLPGVTAVAATSGFIISVAAVGAATSAAVVARLSQVMPVGRLLLWQLALGGLFTVLLALTGHWIAVLVLRTLGALCLGGALTMAYSLGGMIVPSETRGAAFGWLALGVQIGTAASPLTMGAIAAASLPTAFVLSGVLAWVAAGLLLLGGRGLLRQREAGGTP